MKYFYLLRDFVEDLSNEYPRSFYTCVAVGMIALGIFLITAIVK